MSITLDDTQRTRLKQWIDEGLRLSDIQKHLDSEFGLRLTYMEVRFLVDDLRLTPKDIEPPKSPLLSGKSDAKQPVDRPTSPSEAKPETVDLEPEPEPSASRGGVSLTIDQITRPGALVSGKVTFTDGNSAQWYLDQMGRLGVVPEVKGYKPSALDVQAFQMELQNQLARMGF